MTNSLYKSIRRACVLSVFLFAGAFSASIQAVTHPPGFWSLQIENDLWGSNDDRWYTSGWQLSYVSPKPPPEYLENISDHIPFYSKGKTVYHGFNLGQKVFTPENIEESSLIIDDRPYAGWLFFETFIGHRYDDFPDRDKMNGLILTIGIVGPNSHADDIQNFTHDLTDSDDANGWDNQLEDELGLNATFLQKSRRIYNLDEPRQTELSLHGGLTLGSIYSYASVGVMTRWGARLKDDIGPPSISPGFPGLPAFEPNRQSNWYLYAGLEARRVARNVFLDGNTNVDSHSVTKEDWVADLQFGIAVRSADARISFSITSRSKEFKGQPEGSHFGLINFTLFAE